jgi:uncharacterized protein (UPF0261 family)
MSSQKRAWVAATLDTKAEEAEYACALLEATGLPVVPADLSTKEPRSVASVPQSRVQVPAPEVARHHPQGDRAIFCGDRGAAIAAMT